LSFLNDATESGSASIVSPLSFCNYRFCIAELGAKMPMKKLIRHLLIFGALGLAACKSKLEREQAEYLAMVKTTQDANFQSDPQVAYEAEVRFIDFVKERQKVGAFLPNPNVLVWDYPRLAILAEYCGRTDEASRLFSEAEQYARKIYPNEPAAKTSAAALRASIDEITNAEKAPWKKRPIKLQ
jgi:hypothetical protein